MPSSSLGSELPPLTCPIANRATDCSANSLRIYSHNAQGLRGEDKLEYIMRLMTKKKLDAYIIQETHLEGDYVKYVAGDKIMVQNGLLIQPRGGAAIILLNNLTEGWKKGEQIIKEEEKQWVELQD